MNMNLYNQYFQYKQKYVMLLKERNDNLIQCCNKLCQKTIQTGGSAFEEDIYRPLTEIGKLDDTIHKNNKQIISYLNSLDNVCNTLSECNSEEFEEKIENLETSLKNLRENDDLHVTLLQRKEEFLKQKQEEIVGLEQRIASGQDLKVQLKDKQKTILKLEKKGELDRIELQNINDRLQKKIKEFQIFQTKNSSLENDLSEHKINIEQQNKKLLEQTNDINNFTKTIRNQNDEIETQKRAIVNKNDENETQKKKIRINDRKIGIQTRTIMNKNDEIETQKRAIANKNDENETQKKKIRINDHKIGIQTRTIMDKDNEIVRLKNLLSNISAIKDKLKNDIEELRSAKEKLELECSTNRQQQEELRYEEEYPPLNSPQQPSSSLGGECKRNPKFDLNTQRKCKANLGGNWEIKINKTKEWCNKQRYFNKHDEEQYCERKCYLGKDFPNVKNVKELKECREEYKEEKNREQEQRIGKYKREGTEGRGDFNRYSRR